MRAPFSTIVLALASIAPGSMPVPTASVDLFAGPWTCDSRSNAGCVAPRVVSPSPSERASQLAVFNGDRRQKSRYRFRPAGGRGHARSD